MPISKKDVREIARAIIEMRRDKEEKMKKLLSELIINLDIGQRRLGVWELSRNNIRCSIKDGNVLHVPLPSQLWLDLERVNEFIRFFTNAKKIMEQHGEIS